MLEWTLIGVCVMFLVIISLFYIKELRRAKRSGNNQLYLAFLIIFITLWVMYIGTIAYTFYTHWLYLVIKFVRLIEVGSYQHLAN